VQRLKSILPALEAKCNALKQIFKIKETMKLNIFLIFSKVIWSFYEFSSIEGVDPNKRLDKGKGNFTLIVLDCGMSEQ